MMVAGKKGERGDALVETMVGLVMTGIALAVIATSSRTQTQAVLQPTYDVSATTVAAEDIVDELRLVAAYDKTAQQLLRGGGTMQFRGATVSSDGTTIKVVMNGVTSTFDPRSGN